MIDISRLAICVFFFDGSDIETGTFYTLEEAYSENFVEVVGDMIVPTDKCSILYPYERGYFNKNEALEWIGDQI